MDKVQELFEEFFSIAEKARMKEDSEYAKRMVVKAKNEIREFFFIFQHRMARLKNRKLNLSTSI